MEGIVRKQFVHLSYPRRGRMSIVKCLRVIGLPPERFQWANSNLWRIEAKRKAGKKYGHTSFWERHADDLYDIANDMKKTFHEHLKQVGHDFTENHEQSALLIEAYTKAKKMFAAHGVEV